METKHSNEMQTRTKTSPRARMTVNNALHGIIDADGNETGVYGDGSAFVSWGVYSAGSWTNYTQRFATRELANEFANKKWSKIK
jgi:hypothetical protein